MAYYSLAWDLFTLDNSNKLRRSLIKRLRNADSFHGARYELYLAASFLRAGFEIEFEDERDGNNTHCEFTATSQKSGRPFSVEAKATGRPGILGKSGTAPDRADLKVTINRKLKEALSKTARHERIVFVDLNMPPPPGELSAVDAPWMTGIAKDIEHRQREGANKEAAFVLLTNHPFHYVGRELWEERKAAVVLAAINRPGLDVVSMNPGSGLSRLEGEFPEVLDLMLSLRNHSQIPNYF
jgi:hypothetical protein